MLDKRIKTVNEVAQDLRELKDGSSVEHQAKKLDRVVKELDAFRDLAIGDPDFSINVHGSGSGES